MVRRLSITAVLCTLVLAMLPGVAAADVTGSCDGEAIINGVTYTPDNDTPGNAIPIPDEDGVPVTYSGSVGFENLNHAGSAKVQVGPFNITLQDGWAGANTDDERGVANQIYQLDEFRDKLPIWIPGVWKVTASHTASGGECSGFAMIKLAGNPLANFVGWIVLVGLIGFAYWAISAVARRHAVQAAIAALLVGIFLALALMMWAVRPLDTLTSVVLPLVLAVAAGILATSMGRSGSSI